MVTDLESKLREWITLKGNVEKHDHGSYMKCLDRHYYNKLCWKLDQMSKFSVSLLYLPFKILSQQLNLQQVELSWAILSPKFFRPPKTANHVFKSNIGAFLCSISIRSSPFDCRLETMGITFIASESIKLVLDPKSQRMPLSKISQPRCKLRQIV